MRLSLCLLPPPLCMQKNPIGVQYVADPICGDWNPFPPPESCNPNPPLQFLILFYKTPCVYIYIITILYTQGVSVERKYLQNSISRYKIFTKQYQ